MKHLSEEKAFTTTKKNAQSQTNIEISSLNGQETVTSIRENNHAVLNDSDTAKEEIKKNKMN